MRGLKQDCSARIIIAGHAFVQDLRRGHYELAVEEPVKRQEGRAAAMMLTVALLTGPFQHIWHLVSAAAAPSWPNSHPVTRSPTPHSATEPAADNIRDRRQ
jgi:hypothetical protein